MRVLAMTTPKVWAARRSAHVWLAFLALATLVAATTATSADGTGSKAPAAAPERPNIVFILVDDMRADELRFLPKTRRLLGRRGVTYTHALSPHPLCCPARAELITGQYAQNNGVKENFGPWGGFQALKAPDNHIGAWMRDRGYRTGFVGRFLNGYLGGRRIGGWSEWQPLVRRIYDYWRPGFFREDRLDKGYVTQAIRRRAARVIRGFDGDPFFLYVFHPSPHEVPKPAAQGLDFTPPRPERRYRNHYNQYRPPALDTAAFNEKDVSDLPPDLRRRSSLGSRWFITLSRARARALRSVDDSVAHLVSQLAELGELGKTYIVFSSDNGFLFGEHRLSWKELPLRRGTRGTAADPRPGDPSRCQEPPAGVTGRHPCNVREVGRRHPRPAPRWAAAHPSRKAAGHDPHPNRDDATRHQRLVVPRRDDRTLPVRLPCRAPAIGSPVRPGARPTGTPQPVPREGLRRRPPDPGPPHQGAHQLFRPRRLQPGVRPGARSPLNRRCSRRAGRGPPSRFDAWRQARPTLLLGLSLGRRAIAAAAVWYGSRCSSQVMARSRCPP